MNFYFHGIELINKGYRKSLLSEMGAIEEIWKIPLTFIDIILPTLIASVIYCIAFLYSLKKELSWEIIFGGTTLGCIYSYVLVSAMWILIFPLISFNLSIYNLFFIALAMIILIQLFIQLLYGILFE